MAPTNSKRQRRVVKEIEKHTDGSMVAESKLKTTSGDGDELNELSAHDDDEYTDRRVNLKESKKRPKTMATINGLPTELFTYIILFAGLSKAKAKHPHVIYTWVCRHWRTILIQTPTFWSSYSLVVDHRHTFIHPFVHELLRRSNSSTLDVDYYSSDHRFPADLKKLLTKESGHIRRLWLHDIEDRHLVRLVSGSRFPALRGIGFNDLYDGFKGLVALIAASDHVEALRYAMQEAPTHRIDRLTPLFNRIRNLNLGLRGPSLTQPVLTSLHNNANLQSLLLRVYNLEAIHFAHQINLPGLQFLSINNPSLLNHIFAPNLSSFTVYSHLLPIEPRSVTIDFASIKYLYFLDPYWENSYRIVGLKEPAHCQIPLLTKTDNFVDNIEDIVPNQHLDSIGKVFSDLDILYDTYPRDCFRFGFDTFELFSEFLRTSLTSLLSRMTNLTELYLLSHAFVIDYEGTIDQIVSQVPSVEKLVVQYGKTLTDFIRPLADASLCPRLRNLFYVTFSTDFITKEDMEAYAEEVGKTLAECIRSRHKVHGNELKYIALQQCPPLPDTHLNELQNLGATIVAAKDIESVLNAEPQTVTRIRYA